MTDDEFTVEAEAEVDDEEVEDGEERDLNSVATAGENAGAAVTGSILLFLKAIGKLLFAVFVGLTRPIPALGTKIWKGMTAASLRQYHKSAGGDRIGLEATPAGKIELTPVKFRSVDECDDDERPGWTAKGREKTWKPTTLGQSGWKIGKTPVVPLDTESWRSTSILEARVAEAVDQGDTRPLYRVDEAELTANLVAAGGQQPRADGGYNVGDIEFEPRSSPIFEDTIIDLGSENYDGQAVSWDKTKELMLERTTTEEMDNQEERGFLAGRSNKNMMRWAWKMFLAASLVAIAGLIGKELVTVVFGGGGGGGGGGGLIPLTTSVGNLMGL